MSKSDGPAVAVTKPLRLPRASSACSPYKQKNFGLSRAWEEGGAENSIG